MASRREANAAITRDALVAAARQLFGAAGYEASGIEAIADRALVTTGALYHHFPNKRALFQAVAESVEAELLDVATHAGGGDARSILHQGFRALIEPCAAPDVQRIVFLDAPRVLGPAEWHVIEQRYAYGALCEIIESMQADGQIVLYPARRIASVLLATLREVSATVMDTPPDEVDGAVAAAADVMDRVLGSFID